MTTTIDELRSELAGKQLPGGEFAFEPYESAIADRAFRVPPGSEGDGAHPIWFVIASLRGMGISVDELCRLAAVEGDDTLLLGGIDIEHAAAMQPGAQYRTTAAIGAVDRRTTRDGSTLDSVEVTVTIRDHDTDSVAGAVTSTYLFKRAAA